MATFTRVSFVLAFWSVFLFMPNANDATDDNALEIYHDQHLKTDSPFTGKVLRVLVVNVEFFKRLSLLLFICLLDTNLEICIIYSSLL